MLPCWSSENLSWLFKVSCDILAAIAIIQAAFCHLYLSILTVVEHYFSLCTSIVDIAR